MLQQLGRWPARYEDLPQRLRDASLLDALSHLQRYALMLKRQQEDYEAELIFQIKQMSSNRGPLFEFTKFVAGDYTGNISDTSIKSLLSIFQVDDCWNSFRLFSSDIGFGVPSVHELIKDVVRKRHRSAHAAAYAPTAADISGLASNLCCLGICFDVAMTASVEQALVRWGDWANGTCRWRDGIDLYFVDPHHTRFRVARHGRRRALFIIDDADAAPRLVPRAVPGRTAVVVKRDMSGRPISWGIL